MGRAAMVAPLHGAAVLLALLLGAHRDRCLVRVHELLGALHHVRLLRGDGNAVPQGGLALCHLHHLAAAQMLVGMFVTIKAVMYQAAGEECHVNKTNSVLGLSMYASYFLLFFKLFMDNYFLKPKSEKVVRRKSMKDVAKAMSRRMTQTVHDEADADGEVEPAQVGKEGAAKKKLRRGRPSPPAADGTSSVASVSWQGFRACLVQPFRGSQGCVARLHRPRCVQRSPSQPDSCCALQIQLQSGGSAVPDEPSRHDIAAEP